MSAWVNPLKWKGSGRPHGNARLSADLVKEIRHFKGRYSASEVAKLYEVGKQTVLDIWEGKTWRPDASAR